jgi:hypothetical protein
MYMMQLPISRDNVQSVCEMVDKDMVITPKAMNLMAFCLSEVYLDMVSTSHMFLTHSRKKQLDGNTVIFAIRCRFHDSVAHELIAEVERAVKACKFEIKTVDKDEDDFANEGDVVEDSADEDEDEEEQKEEQKEASKEVKGKKEASETKVNAKSSTKDGKKITKKIEDEEDGSDEELPEDDEDDDDDKAKVQAKPAPVAKGKAAAKPSNQNQKAAVKPEAKESKVEAKPVAGGKNKKVRAVN